jgi:hypothetical protein
MQALLPGLYEAISPARQSRKPEIAATPIASACQSSYEVRVSCLNLLAIMMQAPVLMQTSSVQTS